MGKLKHSLFIFFFCCVDSRGFAQENSVWILGPNDQEQFLKKRPGNSLWLKPEDATRFHQKTLLKDQPGLISLDTGAPSSSGFSLPAIRGHDARNTEIWMDDVLLFDPWMNLSMTYALDLKAFGKLEIYEGLSSIEVPSLNSSGTLGYRVRPYTKNEFKAGTSWGDTYGCSIWGSSRYAYERKNSTLWGQLYADTYQTKGNFVYYSDNGTPYNPDDDLILRRENNDQASYQVLPFVVWNDDQNRELKFLALFSQNKGGIAWLGDGDSLARSSQHTKIYNLGFAQALPNRGPLLPRSIKTNLQLRKESRVIQDPANSFQSYPSASQNLSTESGSASLWWGERSTHLHVAHANMRLNDARRSDTKGYLGTTQALCEHLSGEMKLEVRALHNTTRNLTRKDNLVSGGGGVLWQTKYISPYTQFAITRRPPTLLESFGDGARVKPSLDLIPETTHHYEGGIFWKNGRASIYWDEISNKIGFAEASFGTQRALNLSRARLRGITISQLLSITSAHEFTSAFFKLWAQDISHPNTPRTLPFIPENSWANSYTWRYTDRHAIRVHNRYRGETYRDLSNSILVPGSWVWDASWDAQIDAILGVSLKLGLSVMNVFNTNRLEIQSPADPDQQGFTGYSDVTGYPLPGRQMVLNVSGAF